jgi:hypothetical protein
MKARKMFRARRLGFEGLEQRSMLAVVSFNGGILSITGDNTAETVTVTEVTPGTVTVSGTGIATPFTRSGVVGIVADMKGGADTLSIGDAGNSVDLQGGVNILLGNGDDTANLFINTPAGVAVDGGFQTGTLAQNDTVNVTNSTIGTLAVNTYAGDDALTIAASNFTTLVANLGLSALSAGQTDADTLLMTGGGAVVAAINMGTAQTGAANGAEISGSAFTTLAINGGEGIDTITLTELQVSNALGINSFGGADTVTLTGVTATNSLSVSAGAGTDIVTLSAVTTNFAILDGGPGLGDTLADDASPAIGTRLKFGWEIDDPLL